jgi:hypothetical protein
MRSRVARVALAVAITAAGTSLGRLAGAADRSPGVLAQTGGSGSGGGTSGTSSGSSDSSSGGSGSGTNAGGGGGGETGGGTPTPEAPPAGNDGSSGFGGSNNGGSGSGNGGGGEGGTPPGGGTGGTTPGTVASPATTAPVPEHDVRPGTPTSCSSDAGARVRCYRVDPNARGVRVPDGKGGTVVVALPDASPIVDVDTGASTFTSNDVDVEIQVDIDRGEIVGVDQRDRVRQAVLATLGLLLLVAAAFAAGALFMRRRGGGAAT